MEWLELPREPVWDELVRTSWPQFVRARETPPSFPLSADLFWAFDEVLRQSVLLHLSEGRPISIEIPEGSREHYE